MQKKIETIKLTLTFSERWFEKYDVARLNFGEVMMVSRPVRSIKDGVEEWTLEAKPICEDNTAEFVSNHAVEFCNGYKEKDTGNS